MYVNRLFSSEAVGNISGNWNTHVFVLISLDHEKDPENKSDQTNQSENSPAEKVAHKDQADTNNAQSSEDGDRLCGLEFNPWALIDQQEDNSGNPANCITKKPRNIFGQTFAAGGGRGAALIGAALWAKS